MSEYEKIFRQMYSQLIKHGQPQALAWEIATKQATETVLILRRKADSL